MVGNIERRSDGLLVKYGSRYGERAVGGEIASVGPFGIFKIVLDKKRHQKEYWGKERFVALGAHVDDEWLINEIEWFIEEQNSGGDIVDLRLADEDGNTIQNLLSVNLNQPAGSSGVSGPFTVPQDCLFELKIEDNNAANTSGRIVITIKYTV